MCTSKYKTVHACINWGFSNHNAFINFDRGYLFVTSHYSLGDNVNIEIVVHKPLGGSIQKIEVRDGLEIMPEPSENEFELDEYTTDYIASWAENDQAALGNLETALDCDNYSVIWRGQQFDGWNLGSRERELVWRRVNQLEERI